MRMLVHHPIQHVHRFIDGPTPAPEILILTVWHGEPLTKRQGWLAGHSYDAKRGVWLHDYYRRQRELIGDSYPEYEFVLSRRSRTGDGRPPHVPGLTAPQADPEKMLQYNERKRLVRAANRARERQKV